MVEQSNHYVISKSKKIAKSLKNTNCDIEVQCKFSNVISQPDKETSVPYKICSFDIEASSSHGDFPTPIKNYKKVGYDVIEYISKNEQRVQKKGIENIVYNLLRSTFGFTHESSTSIDICYPKHKEYDETMFDVQYNKIKIQNIYIEEERAEIGELHN